MHISYCSIFPELFESFISTTLVSKAIKNKRLKIEIINPRHFCEDKHRIVDDEIYGWGHGLLMKAPPIIKVIRHRIMKHKLTTIKKTGKQKSWMIIIPHPSPDTFCQTDAHIRSEKSHLLFVCGRYEGIDERVWLWLEDTYPDHCQRISLWHFITLGGELPAMTMTEAVVRLIPWVIHTEMSRVDESYNIDRDLSNIEYPQYTRPEIVEDMPVPEVLLSGHHSKISAWKDANTRIL
jgi:tRNA (guanine37-N1)-methyltransferase